jgi:hypothetical protein
MGHCTLSQILWQSQMQAPFGLSALLSHLPQSTVLERKNKKEKYGKR